MIIKPTIEQLSQGKYNRYTLVQAAAKGARMITAEYEQHIQTVKVAKARNLNTFVAARRKRRRDSSYVIAVFGFVVVIAIYACPHTL